MKELPQPLKRIQARIERVRTFIKEVNSERSEDVDGLLSEGKIEQLVRQGRTPMQIGTIGCANLRPTEDDKPEDLVMKPYYQIPPVGFHPRDIREVYMGAGVFVFVNKLGISRVGPTFTLTEEQARQVEDRIQAERERVI